MRVYLTLVEAMAIHEVLIDEFGGSPGPRDQGALEAALFRPQTGYYADTVEEAAAMMESLIQNHPFVDGNKRVAVAATDVFLRLNGLRLDIDDLDAHRFLIELIEAGGVRIVALHEWLRTHLAV